MKKFSRWTSALLALYLIAVPLAANDAAKEYYIKAAFIYNFVKFTEWQDEHAIALHNNINICVLGDNPFTKAASVFKEASSAKLSLTLMQVASAEEAGKQCHVVFISNTESERITEDIEALKNFPTLTTSDIPGFAKKGGMIEFTLQGGKIKIIINAKAAEQAGLKLDAQLLEIALSVIH